MQDEKMLLPEKIDLPEIAVREVMFVLPSGENGINLVNTIADTAKLCRKFNVGLTEWNIRRLCDSGAIPFIRMGSKRMVNWNVLIRYVNSGGDFCVPRETKPTESGIIARIPEKLRA